MTSSRIDFDGKTYSLYGAILLYRQLVRETNELNLSQSNRIGGILTLVFTGSTLGVLAYRGDDITASTIFLVLLISGIAAMVITINMEEHERLYRLTDFLKHKRYEDTKHQKDTLRADIVDRLRQRLLERYNFNIPDNKVESVLEGRPTTLSIFTADGYRRAMVEYTRENNYMILVEQVQTHTARREITLAS